ncbi:MAG: hypothetical protein IPL75_00315 [Acidobacteria bacterium]|nr:hypothetical protein [Acidobacteriota bacterium]
MKAFFIIAALVSVVVSASTQQPQFKASTAAVRLEVSVTDERGAVQGLQARDFVVEDSGKRQVVRSEESTDVPLDLVMVAQPLSSLAYTSQEQTPLMGAGLTAFLTQVEERDRLAAIVAGAPPSRIQPLTFGKPSFDSRAFKGGDFAAPFDAIAAALGEFVPSDRRRALVAFTSAADFRSTLSFEALERITRRLGPAFVLVGTPVRVEEHNRFFVDGPTGRQIADTQDAVVSGAVFPRNLERLADRTGGITVNLGDGNPDELMERMFTWLRTQYVISYQPPAGQGWHPVSVKVNRKGATVTVREGYFVDGPPG